MAARSASTACPAPSPSSPSACPATGVSGPSALVERGTGQHRAVAARAVTGYHVVLVASRPLRRGGAAHRLADALGAGETVRRSRGLLSKVPKIDPPDTFA